MFILSLKHRSVGLKKARLCSNDEPTSGTGRGEVVKGLTRIKGRVRDVTGYHERTNRGVYL